MILSKAPETYNRAANRGGVENSVVTNLRAIPHPLNVNVKASQNEIT
jgi:hypothetical protein